jgi:glucokinase
MTARQRTLAIDVGGSHIKWAIVAGGQIVQRGTSATPRAEPALLAALARIVDETCSHEHIDRIGVAIAAWVDPISERIEDAASLELLGWDLRAALRSATGRSVDIVVNDLVAACAAESGRGEPLGVLAVGTGLAGRLVHDGVALTGARGLAGEVGHHTYLRGGRRCGCGRLGCAEAYAGWAGIQRAFDEHGERLSGPCEVMARATHDAFARRTLDEALDAAGFAAATFVAATDPGELRVAGGMLAAWGNVLVAAIRAGVADRCWHGGDTRVEPARCGVDAQLLGVARLAAA